MLKLCIDNIPQFEYSDIEIQRGGVSYTIETIREMKKEKGVSSADFTLFDR